MTTYRAKPNDGTTMEKQSEAEAVPDGSGDGASEGRVLTSEQIIHALGEKLARGEKLTEDERDELQDSVMDIRIREWFPEDFE